MRAYLIIIVSLFGCFTEVQAALQSWFSYSTFYAPAKGAYIETYLSVAGASPVYQRNDAGTWQARLQVTYAFVQGDKIVKALKYHLNSPEIQDSTHAKPNFIDQQRIVLNNGTYVLRIEITDVFGNGKPYKAEQVIEVAYPENQMSISDVQFLDVFIPSQESGPLVKHGYKLIPNIGAFFPPAADKLNFYAEVYNTDKVFGEEKFLLRYSIADYENNKILPRFTAFVRMEGKDVNILLREISIVELPSGNYNLFLEIRDRENNLRYSKTGFFQRSNPEADEKLANFKTVDIENTFVEKYRNKDTICDLINALRPIANTGEKSTIDQLVRQRHEHSQESMQKFFYGFWQNRNPADPEGEWKQYAAEVEKVNNEFSTTIKKGYETDRGRVYLQYGPPNSRISYPSEPSTYPYEVWQYYTIRNQNNGRFIFYNSDLVTNEYELLHSTVRGELQNYRWQYVIQGRNITNRDIDDEDPGSSHGNRSDDFFEMPR
ncbi:MAG: GWxTD domain-containing protein [Flavobacteriales bacterium]|nr:GWxTD domain-containing protein [Flavobacteriales bacterium]